MIAAGFELTLEDETDSTAKHCEFAAVSKETGQKFWIEAKMRSVSGLFGKTDRDGVPEKTAKKATSKLIQHLNAAFQKPVNDQRMIFIDLNAEMAADINDDNRQKFLNDINNKLSSYERNEKRVAETAYIFITNMTFHRDLLGPAQMLCVPTSVGIPDFNRPGNFRLRDVYLRERKHADALRVAEGMANILRFPITFDGSMPATTLLGERPPLVIGERYLFQGVGPTGEDLAAKVVDVQVMDAWKAAMVIVATDDGRNLILREDLSEAQLADYRAHPDAYNGRIRQVPTISKTPFDFFKFLVDSQKGISRSTLI